MDLSTWRPYGLITKPTLEILYLSARVNVDNRGNIIDPKEHKTVELFSTLFNKVIFSEDPFTCVPQEPPNLQSNKACDLVIKYATVDMAYQVLCFAEAKRANNQRGSQIEALESQALGYCKDFFAANGNVDIVYACTMVGTCVRCWTVSRVGHGQAEMRGFWDGHHKKDFKYYLDVGLDQNRATLMNAFNFMKTMPTHNMPLNLSYNDIGRVTR